MTAVHIARSFTHPQGGICNRLYFSKNKEITKKIKKGKESKEEKKISVENLTGYDDIVCEYAAYF